MIKLNVIGLLAPSGSGKTALAQELARGRLGRVEVLSIAQPIKDNLRDYFGIKPGWEGIAPFGGMIATNYREACQFYGDMLRGIDRRCLMRDLWRRVKLSEAMGFELCIIDDVRLPEECEDIAEIGGRIFLIRRPEVLQSKVATHGFHSTERYARACVENPDMYPWQVFDNDQPLDLAAQSLYAATRGI